jgi:sugar lactone lactonase YvrE
MLPSWIRFLARFVNQDDPRKCRSTLRPRFQPNLEPLENRITPSTLIPVTDHSDLVFDPGRNLLYIPTHSGQVQRWDVRTQRLLPAWNVGTSLNGADITPDGKSLYVAEDQTIGTHGFFHQVNLRNGSVTDVPYTLSSNAAGAWDIAIAANGKAIVSTKGAGGGPVQLLQLDTASNTYTIRSDAAGGAWIGANTIVRRGPNRGLFLLSDPGFDTGHFYLYNATTDMFSQERSSGDYSTNPSPAVNRDDTLLGIELSVGPEMTTGASIIDSNLRAVRSLPGILAGVVFDPNQDVVYGVSPTLDQILAYDTNTWSLKYSIPVGEMFDGSGFYPAQITVSADSKYLFLGTASGVREYALPQATGVAASLQVSGFPAFVTNGVAGSVTITAVDPASNVVTGYTGTIHFSSTSAGNLPADYTFTPADNGSHTFTGVNLTTTGTQTITVDDSDNAISGSQADIVVHDAGTTYIPVADHRDLVYDPTRNVLYITTISGLVQRYDVATQTLLTPFQVGGILNGADITPDGSALYVADNMRGITQDWFHRVNLDTGAVTNLPYNIGDGFAGDASWDVAIGPDGKGLGDERQSNGSGGGATLQQINTADDTLSPRPDQTTVSEFTTIHRAADRSLFILAEGNRSDGPLLTYDSGTDSFPHSTESGGFADNASPQVNRNGTLIAINVYGTGIQVYDANLHPVKTLHGVRGGICFDPVQDVMYVADVSINNIIAYDTSTWDVLSQTDIGETMGLSDFGSGVMAMSGDGKLFLATPTEIRIFQTSPRFLVSDFPSSVIAGTPGSITVKAVDTSGNVLTNYTGTVHFTSSDPQAALPADYTFVPGDNGSHTFDDVILTTAGRQSITATDSTTPLNGYQTNIIVSAAAADHLRFTALPGSATAGQIISPAVQVQIVDRFDNLVRDDNSDLVNVSVASGPGDFTPGSTTNGTVSGGIASFSNLVLNTAGTYTFGASGTGGLGGATSGTFRIDADQPDHLTFSVPPSDLTAGQAISPAVQVQVLDQFGNVVSDDNTDQVSVSVASGPAGFTSGSTTIVTVSGGVATFRTLVLNPVGTYDLTASVPGLGDAHSVTFSVNPAAGPFLSFSVQPSSTTAGMAISPAVEVQVLDRFGTLLTDDNSDQVTMTVVSGPRDFTTDSTTSVTVNGGIATFSNLVLTTAGPCVLGASGTGGLISATSVAFSVSPAGLDHLVFIVQPSDTTAGQVISPAIQVQALDQFGNPLSNDDSDQVHLSLANGAFSNISGDTTATFRGGIATFSNLVFYTAGNYNLQADPGDPPGLSVGFTIRPANATQLVVSPLPDPVTAGQVISPAVQVMLEDTFGNVVTQDNTDQIEVHLLTGPGRFDSSSNTTLTLHAGAGTFSNLKFSSAGVYTIQFTGPASLSNGPITVDVARAGPPPSWLASVASLVTHSTDYDSVVVQGIYQRILSSYSVDDPTVAFWVAQMQGGLSDEQLEADFIASPQYVAAHGGIDSSWVSGLYHDLLGRDSSQAEVDGWLQALAGGMTRTQVAFGFTSTPEREAMRVKDDYQNFLGRTPSDAEVAGWVQAFVHGTSNESISADFVGSTEYFQDQQGNVTTWFSAAYQALFGGPFVYSGSIPGGLAHFAQTLTQSTDYDAEVVTAIYQRFTGSAPTATEAANGVAALQSGVPAEELEAELLAMPVYIAQHGGNFAGWVRGMYHDLLSRTPSQAEVDGWLQALAGGVTPTQVAFGLTSSAERETQRIVDEYQHLLGRTPSAAEVASWVSAFAHGMSNDSILAEIVGSLEFYQNQNSRPADWLYQAVLDVFGPAGF